MDKLRVVSLVNTRAKGNQAIRTLTRSHERHSFELATKITSTNEQFYIQMCK